MIRVGIVGFGFMGRMHYRCWQAVPGAKVVAICEGNPQALKQAGGGNIAGSADAIDLSGVAVFTDFDQLLAAKVVDVISITLPTYLHAEFSERALAAGLHVLCEKPMALNIADCERMIVAARSSGNILQIGHCIRFWPAYAAARALVRGGSYGAPVAASFRRLGSAPQWNATNWFADEKRSGGMALDLHIHDSDFVQDLFGLPRAVFTVADAARLHMQTAYLYATGPAVHAEGSWRMGRSFGFEMSFNLVLEQATVAFDSTRTPALRICPHAGDAFVPPLPPGDGYSHEIEHFAARVRGESVPEVLTLEQSRASVRLVLAERESARLGTVVEL